MSFYTLKSENGTRDVLYYIKYARTTAEQDRVIYGPYDHHIAPEFTHFIDFEGIIEIAGKEYGIRPGDVFLLRSNEKHRIIKSKGRGTIENLRFDPAFVWQGNDSFDLNYLNIFAPAQDGFENRLDRENPALQTVRDLLGEIGQEFLSQKYGYAHMVKMRLFMILLTLMRDFGFASDERTALRSPSVEGIRNTMRYIDEHLTEPLTIAELAALAGLSPNYYTTQFKHLNGLTPVEYINTKRVFHAIELLPNFRGTMLELALACGFNSTANFNRAFRAYTGQVPSKYIPPIK